MTPDISMEGDHGVTSRGLEFRERRLRQVRGAQVLAAAGGLTTLIAGGFLIDEFSGGALVGVVIGIAVLAGGVTLARRLAQTVRYRIDKPNSTVVLSTKIAALVAVFFGVVAVLSAVDAPSAPRSVIVVLLVGSLAAVVNAHASRWTLFQIDATGMRVGQAGVPWPAVARIDVATAGLGAVEIGVQLVAGQVVNGTPVPGRVLSDLPVCTLVPAEAVQMDRLAWAVREFGNPAIPVVLRDQPRPPAPPNMPGPIAPPTPPNMPGSIAPPAPPQAPPPPDTPAPPPAEMAIPAADESVPIMRAPAFPTVHATLPTESPAPATDATQLIPPPEPETTDHIAGPPTPADTPAPDATTEIAPTPDTPPPDAPAQTPASPRFRTRESPFQDPRVPVSEPASPPDTPAPHTATPPPGVPAPTPDTPAPHTATPPPGIPVATPATPPPGIPAPYPATPPPGIPAYPAARYPYAPPPKSKRPWLIGGAIAVAVVLAAGAVTAVAITGGDDEPGTAAEQEAQAPTYSTAAVDEPCDLIDVYILKSWSTETKIVTEPSKDTHPDYDYLHCGAHSDSEYLVGRVTHLEMVVVVGEDARAAKAYEKDQRSGSQWSVTGDVQEKGKVDGLAESAEFEQAISTYTDHTRADYVLRVRDDNLVFLLKFGSDADQSDGEGVTVGTLADSAQHQARVAMEKLRDRPAEKKKQKKDAEPAAVPKTIHDAVTLPSTQDLMGRIRGADPCELHDREAMATYGTRIEVEPEQALGLAECRLMVVAGKERFSFGIDLNEYLAEDDRADLVPENLGGMELFHTKDDGTSNGCTYYVPYGKTGFGATVSLRRYTPGVENQAAWPKVCEAAGDYTAGIAEKVAELPARSKPVPEPTVIGKDPCRADEVVDTLLPDWKLGQVSRYYSAQCRFTVKQGDDTYEIEMDFDRDAEQIGDEPASVGGLTGVWIKYEGLCSLSLVYVPETTPDTWDAHNIGVSVQRTGGYGEPGAQEECILAQGAAELLISGL
jgi:hypothetical protein